MKLNHQARIVQDHIDLGADGFHELWLTDERRSLDFLGRRRPGSYWVWRVIRCNNSECPGEWLISDDAITKFLAFLTGARP